MKKTKGQYIFAGFNYLFMIALVIVTLYPMLYVAVASLSNPARLLAHQGLLYKPLGFTFDSYKTVLSDASVIRGFLNTLFIIVTKTALSLLLTIIGAYLLSRKNSMFVPTISFFIVVTMFFSGGLIPTYMNVKSLGMDNSLAALIFPSVISTFNLIILRTAFYGIPSSLEESAMIDGAGRVVVLFKVLLPLIVPTVMVITLYTVVGTWNSWFDAMIYLRTRKLFPLQLILREILVENSTLAGNGGSDTLGATETVKYAIIMVSTIPVMLVYPFMQKHFTSGVMVGAVKG